eukprot:TRINITY_DN7626_c0_g4_i1.p2 TRINITY_DN7626_c0_g4~~TRINITY_DN7626_c0_g4_i1.p2  ORF type:complete len:111 (+),score=12.22 TRINITY_DN7626_c0_g4_i1:32-364(+)
MILDAEGRIPETPPHICERCGSNLWCNQRVRKLVMSLRCHVCKQGKKLNKNDVWYRWKCDTFHQKDTCPLGKQCTKMHIYYSKVKAKNSELNEDSPDIPLPSERKYVEAF